MKGTDSYRVSIQLLEIDSNTPEFSDCTADYRASSVTVSGFDLTDMSQDPLATIEPLKAMLIGKGIIHLFRDFQDNGDKGVMSEDLPGDDTMVLIIAVPTYFTATDILGFIGDHYMDFLTHIRILKSEKANRFLVLLKFSDAVKAAEFQYHYDGKPFNSMEPEACHVVFVKSIMLGGSGTYEGLESLLPFIVSDPFTGSRSLKGKQHPPEASQTQIELPTCPVCLERLDHEVLGLLTIPCQHTFHCQCLSRWRDDTCPVCRYANNIPNNNIRQSVRRLLQINSKIQYQQNQQSSPGDTGKEQSVNSTGIETCMACPVAENLWVCLICGNIGCSRYAPGQHSLNHFIETGHCFAMELSSSRVWDYAGDKYVHRLITSESDGKIVEFPEKDGSKLGTSKVENQQIESSELLLSQLISQREYYELLLKEKTGTERTKRTSSVAENQCHIRRISELETQLGEVTDDLDKLKVNVIPALQRKISMKEVSLKVASQELIESNTLNEGLSQKVDFLTAQNKELKAQIEDLGDQVKDLMFYLESQAKFKDQPDDVKEGQIILKPSKAKKPKKKRK